MIKEEEFSLYLLVLKCSGKIVIQPFSYQPLREAHLWVKKTDEFLLRYGIGLKKIIYIKPPMLLLDTVQRVQKWNPLLFAQI